MIEYKLFTDGSGICTQREEKVTGERITFKFPENSALRVGIIADGENERFFNLTNGECEISANVIKEGENRITAYGKNKRWKCERLLREGEKLSPCGVDSAEEISAFKTEYEKIYARLSMCEARIFALEEKTNSKNIFNS